MPQDWHDFKGNDVNRNKTKRRKDFEDFIFPKAPLLKQTLSLLTIVWTANDDIDSVFTMSGIVQSASLVLSHLTHWADFCTERWGSSTNVAQLVSDGSRMGTQATRLRANSHIPYTLCPSVRFLLFNRHCITSILFRKDPAIGKWTFVITMLILFIKIMNHPSVLDSKYQLQFMPKVFPTAVQQFWWHSANALYSFLRIRPKKERKEKENRLRRYMSK